MAAAEVVSNNNGGPQTDLQVVPLYWSEFVWSLEKLRHRAYSKKMTESDWFRINPLEMVLLGCQTLHDCREASRDQGTFVMKMEDISEAMSKRPRYWNRLMNVFEQTIRGKETPGVIVQRCTAGIVNCWWGISRHDMLSPGFYSWCVNEFKLLELIDFLLSEKAKYLLPSTNQDILDISMAIQAIQSDASEIFKAASIISPPTNPTDTLEYVLTSVIANHDRLQPGDSAVLIHLASFTQGVKGILLSSQTAEKIKTLSNLFVRDFDKSLKALMDISLLVLKHSDEDGLALLISEISSLIEQKFSKFKSDDLNLNLKLMETIHVVLASNTIGLPQMIEFLTTQISSLLMYSSEGYLSNDPVKFLVQLLQFISSLSEQGIPPMDAILVHLPNLFGPFFGVHSHPVSCGLLEYGLLSVCSQHKKHLLGEGIHHLANVWRLFPPIDKAIAEEKAMLTRQKVWEACQVMVDQIVDGLPMWEGPSEESCDMSCDLGDDGDDDVSLETSEVDRLHDNDLRETVLVHLLELACSMVRNGDNICFLYASILPRLFSPTPPIGMTTENLGKLKRFFGEEPPPRPTSIPWNVDKKPLAIHLLSLSIASVHNEMATPFQLCGIVLPKLVANLDTMDFNDSDKLTLSVDILNITKKALEEGHSIEEFISHGLELLCYLSSASVSMDDFRSFTRQLVQHVVASNQSSVLFLIRNACVYLRTFFPEDNSAIQELFRAVIFKGRRSEIRSLFRVCRDPFKDDYYSKLRVHLYKYGKGELTGRQLQALCELIVGILDLTKVQSERSTVIDEEELSQEEKEEKKNQREKRHETLKKLVQPCINKIDNLIKGQRFKKESWDECQRDVSKLTLIRVVFYDELANYCDRPLNEVEQIFHSKFPQEVLLSNSMLDLLSSSSMRIEHTQVPRYAALKFLLTKLLKDFLTIPLSELPGVTTETDGSGLLKARCLHLQDAIRSLPRNVEDWNKLIIHCGYSEKIWTELFTVTVTTDGSHSLEENMRQALLACYEGYTNLLMQMGITHVSVNGELVKCADLFSEDLTLDELKGHRSVAVKTIDQKLGGTTESRTHERKMALLSQEVEIEADFDKQANAPIKPKSFTAALNVDFWECSRCCGAKIIGCYVPTGEHCERPLEIGLRIDSGFLSLYDENGIEIENCEVLFCEEGLYIYKAYTNGHPYDTSHVWVQVFTKLLELNDNCSLVPSIIVPKNFPNQRTWNLLRRSIQPEITGAMLTCRPDFSPEWRTYYDYRPEKVRCGMDMILQPGFSLDNTPSNRPMFMRQRSVLSKDLAGLIFEDIITEMIADGYLKQFRFLGKYISQYISVLIESGEMKSSLIHEGFDYDRWSKGQSSCHGNSSKEEVIAHIVDFVNVRVIGWCQEADITQLHVHHHRLLLQLKVTTNHLKYIHFLYQLFLDNFLRIKKDRILSKKLSEVKNALMESLHIVSVGSLPRVTQEELMCWVFHNEDRVWRYRGGRCGHETLQQFMGFLGDGLHGNRTCPGVATFMVPSTSTSLDLEHDCKVENLVGYSIGELINPSNEGALTDLPSTSCYEIALGWVHPKYRRLNVSIDMYFHIMGQVSASYIVCDVVKGSVERIIDSNPLLRVLKWLRLSQYIIWRRQKSYVVQLETGNTEEFEQVVFRVWPMRLSLIIYRMIRNVTNILKFN